ncbi:MAG: hypothetical protein KAQ64_05240 [Candidatus Pacebacteria bacterium]|nr:hypothetical protein [Candidatus Paceibacterota bacterium]
MVKSRAVYGVEREVIKQLDAYDSAFDRKGVSEDDLNKKLSNGNYSVLTVLKGKGIDEWEVLLGRITPYKKNGKNKLPKKVEEKLDYWKFGIENNRFLNKFKTIIDSILKS